MNQRWRDGRDAYRPAGETINAREYDVAEIGESDAKAFVCQHHYSACYPAARVRVGMFRRGELVGVAVFSHPCNDKVLTSVFPGRALDAVELGRFVLLDEVPGNGETWFLARCFEVLRAHALRGVVSFSDPLPRQAQDGATIFPGHVGTIYQAHNAIYLGRGTARLLRLLPNGLVFSDRAISKIRKRDQGWGYASAQLEAFGAAPLGAGADAGEWLKTWMPRITRRMKHPGNFKYAWGLSRKTHRGLPESQNYPKGVEHAA